MLSYRKSGASIVVALLLVMVFGIHFLSVSAANVIVELPWGQSVSEVVSPDETVDMFTFRAQPNQSLFLMLSSSPEQQAPSVTLQNVTTQELVASLRMSITGMCLRVLPGEDEYMLMVRQTDTTERYPFVVMTQPNPTHELNCPEEAMTELGTIITAMDQGDESVALGGVQFGDGSGSNGGNNPGGNNPGGDDDGDDDDKPIVIPPGTPPSTCDGSSLVNVNLRAQPSANANILGQVAAHTDLPILGSVATSAWVLVDSNNTLGFITGAHLDLKGNCGNVPVVSVGADVSTVLGTTLDLAANLDLGLANLADANANVNVGLNGTGVNADANINAGVGGAGGINVNGGVNVGAGAGGVNVGADVNVGAGGTGILNVGADVGTGAGGVNVGAGVNVGGTGGINVGADVGVGSGGVNVGAGVNAGGTGGLNVGADVGVGSGGINAGVNVGDTGAGVNVGQGGIGVNVGGTGINIGSGGINIGGSGGSGGINIGGGGGFLGLGF